MDRRDDHLQYLQSTRQKHCRNWMLIASYQWNHQGWCDTLWSANGSLVVWSSLESHRQIGRRYQLVNLGLPIEFITTRFPNYQWPLGEPRTWNFLWTSSTSKDETKIITDLCTDTAFLSHILESWVEKPFSNYRRCSEDERLDHPPFERAPRQNQVVATEVRGRGKKKSKINIHSQIFKKNSKWHSGTSWVLKNPEWLVEVSTMDNFICPIQEGSGLFLR